MANELQEQEIRERAYSLWQMAGSPEGREEEFWIKAKEQLIKENGTMDVDEASEQSFPASDPVNRM